MYIIEKKLKPFCAAHRLIKNYQGKCRHLHGHNYSVSVIIAGEKLNTQGLLIDFDDIKRLCDHWLDQHVDHTTLVSSADTELLQFLRQTQQAHYILPGDQNTSAECLAGNFFMKFTELLTEFNKTQATQVRLVEVRVSEKPGSTARYT